MYNDYPTIYETSINESVIYLIIVGIVLLILFIISLLSLAKIFKKANRSGISAFIPIYNIITLLEITNSSKLYLLFLLIPGINVIFYLFVMFSLASFFKKSKAFAFGLAFLPFVFYPILAFSNSEYLGINLTAMEGKSVVADVPKVVDSEDKNPVVHEEKDTSLKNINISIGGGVYQKDYTNTLLNVDENQAIPNKNPDSIENPFSVPNYQSNDDVKSSKTSFVSPTAVEGVQMSNDGFKTMTIDFPSQINFTEEKKDEIKIESMANSFDNLNSSNPSFITLAADEKEKVLNDEPKIMTIDFPSQIESKTPVESKNQIIDSKQSSFTTNSTFQTVNNDQFSKKSEFISCPKCGAKIKGDAKNCFLCGERLN